MENLHSSEGRIFNTKIANTIISYHIVFFFFISNSISGVTALSVAPLLHFLTSKGGGDSAPSPGASGCSSSPGAGLPSVVLLCAVD